VKSRVGYVLAAICLLAGMAVAAWLASSAYSDLQTAMTRVVVPGSGDLNLEESGNYTIYHEAESIIDGKLYSASDIGGLRVDVTDAGGQRVVLATPGFSTRYTIGSRRGRSMLTFVILLPGHYRISAAYPDGKTEPQTVLAVGHDFFSRLFATIFGAIGSVFVGFAAALTLALTTYFRRRRLAQAA
jgi:hypothetical protein